MYDYLESIKEDVKNYIEEESIKVNDFNKYNVIDELNELLWNNDSITGNASGSYFCNAYKAYECLFGNEDLIERVKDEIGIDESRAYDWEYLDVSIRCYLLSQAIEEVIAEIIEEQEEQEAESEE